jgi:hypothetical protein
MQQDSTDPTGVRDTQVRSDGTPVRGKEVQTARQRKAHAAIELRKAGASWDDVAQVLGYPTGRAALVATEKSLEKDLSTDESKEFMRRMAGQRLDRLLRGVWKKAIDEDHPDQFAAIDRARAIIADQRKTYGLDAPTEMVVHNPTGAELEKWVAQVMAAQSPAVEEADIFDAEFYEDEEPKAVEG